MSGLAQWGKAEPEEAHKDPLENCFASPKANNFYEWVSTIVSPSDRLLSSILNF
ncbi:hypothetical protein SELMODRAFT_119913 [Selaginella moellendorffii]|uniref:Uncharacterized protein n=1 Tax=Selaginella moellendorffii TaxID=88036 RepID=D8SLA6_SELML|nr:hypothetical protein SELMODRAFT_119913 [Selaginella moellendorffii]